MHPSFRHDHYGDRPYHVDRCDYCWAKFDSNGVQSEVGCETLSPFYDTALVDRDHICRVPFFVSATGNWSLIAIGACGFCDCRVRADIGLNHLLPVDKLASE
jgi:hypothetical protein